MKFRRQRIDLEVCMIKPVENKDMISFNNVLQLLASRVFGDSHVKVHVVRMDDEQKIGIFFAHGRLSEQRIKVSSSRAKFKTFLKGSYFAAESCCLSLECLSDHVAPL